MSKTADDLVYEVAGILGKVVPGEELGSVEYDKINAQVTSALDMISGIVVLDSSDIPDNLFKAIADIVAACAAPHFGGSEPNPDVLERLEDRVRYLSAPGRILRTLKIDPAAGVYRRNYYDGRH
jgi:hypothetical protein